MKQLKRCLAFALVFAMCVTMIPERTFAAEISEEAAKEAGTPEANVLSGTEASENGNSLESEARKLSENEDSTEAETQALSETGNVSEGETQALSEDGNHAGADTFEEDIVSEEESQEELYASQTTEEFTVLTVGQELHHTATGLKYYRFKPEESGIYYFTMESKNAGDTFSADITKTIHSKGEKTFQHSYFQQIAQAEKVERIMCLNSDETYEFYCWMDDYADSANIDICLMMKKVEIAGVEAVTPPTAASSERFDGTGMKVKINFADGTNVTSDVINNTYAGGSSILILDWNNVAYNPTENISKTLTVFSVNGTAIDYGTMPPADECSIISGLPEGEYPIELGISHYISESSETKNYKFETTFQVDHNGITGMEVTPEEDTYTEKFAQKLQDISLKVTYEDGTTETVRTNDFSTGYYVNQYLPYGEYEMPNGTKQPYQTTEIDTYLDNGGAAGKADVTVEYRGQKTGYEITILENPYSGISKIEPNRTIYYTDTSYKDAEHNASYAGDTITGGNVGKVSLSRKDGEADVSYSNIYNMPGYSEQEYSSYVKYGLKTDNKYYKDIEAYLAAGGSTGTSSVTVNYISRLEKTYNIEIRENPYKRIEIVQKPAKTEYEYNSRGGTLELNGLVLHAYKEDGTCDTFTYGEDDTSVLDLEWSGYLHAYSDKYAGKNSYGGDSDYFRSYPGKHTAYVVFMGLRAEYEVQVADEKIEEPTVMTELEIIKNPARNVFYINEKDYTEAFEEELLAPGLEIQLKDSKGGVTKYKYGQNSSFGGYQQWSSYNIGFDTSQIDWATPGTYQYTVYHRKNYDGKPEDVSADLKKDIAITIADSPIESFTIIREPEKKTFYAYERTTDFNRYLYGMAYKITFDDGSVYADTVRSADTSSLSFSYRGNLYSARQTWARTSSERFPALGENTIKFTLFGDTYQMEGFSFEENTVSSIQFEKYPQKQIYMGSSFMDNKIDLYGAEIKITYADGTSEMAQITGHGPSAIVGKYGEEITSKFEYHMPDTGGAVSIPYVKVSYMGQTAEFMAEPDFDNLDVSSARTITDGGQTDVITLDRENRYQVVSFTPEEAGTYYFYCIDAEVKDMGSNSSFVVGLYGDGNWLVPANNAGTWDFPCYYWGDLEAGKTYYYIVSMQDNDTKARCQCYLSSTISGPSVLGEVSGIEVTGTDYNVRYDYELENTYSPLNIPGAYMSGTHYKLSYDNAHNWTEEKFVVSESRMSSVSVGNEYLSVEWEHKKKDTVTGTEDPFMPEVRDDNALVYTYKGEEVAKIPAKVGVASPVESLTINNNPWENTYEYQADFKMEGLSVTVHYTDASGKTDKTVVWDSADSLRWNRKQVDGYEMEAVYSDAGKTDSNGVKIYNLSVSYMGAEIVKEISYAQNPVTGFEVTDEPQKKVMYPFDETPDLYGMKFKIRFRDNTEQNVEVSEHDKSVALPDNSTEKVSGSIRTDNGKKSLYLTGMGRAQKIMDYESAELPLDDTAANKLTVAQTKYAVLDGDNYYKIYAFTAEEEGEYTFAVTGTINRKLFLYSKSGEVLGTADSTLGRRELQRDMDKDETVYLAVLSTEIKYIGSTAATVTEKDIQKTDITDVNMEIRDIPVGGESLPEVMVSDSSAGYAIDSYQWYGDEDGNGKADFATSHRLQVILVPDKQNGFTSETNVSLNVVSTGHEAENTALMLGADGKLTLYYTFPYTECKIDFPQIDGYTLDTSGNKKEDRVTYGEDYTFRYTNAAGEVDSSLIVKVNGNLVPLTNGSYTLEHVTENVTVIVKSGNVTAGSDETLLTLYNRSTDACDVIIGKRNRTIKDNTNGENTLPVLPGYVGGSTDFFYGWYLEKDASLNGMGTRFTSVSKLLKDAYSLYSKWGSGFFSATLRGRTLGYQVLSFDEYNDMRVQVTGASARSRSVYASQSNDNTNDGIIIADEEVLVIPASLTQSQMSLQEDLNIDVEHCSVIAIADHAFANTEEVKNVVLPDTIESVGEGAFANCTSLEEINIPKGVTEIGGRAFEGCTSLQEIVIPSTVTSLNEGTFRGCQDLTVVLPDTMQEIDKNVFEDVRNVTIICSSELAGTDTVESVKGSEVTVQTVDIELGDTHGNKTFTYGDEAETFMASVKVDGVEEADRALEWNVTDTDAFSYSVDGNYITVAPKRTTKDTENIYITVTDKATHLEKSISLKTNAADLSGKSENGESLYVIEAAGGQVYSGEEICPNVVVKKNAQGGAAISTSDYDVFYSDNIEAGTGRIVIKGKGNYVGNLSQTFTIEKAQQFITASDLVKSTADMIFALGAKSDGGGRLSYTSSNPQAAVIDEYGMVRICGEGVTEICIRAAETKNYKESEKTIKLTVNKMKDFVPVVTAPKSELKVAKTAYTMPLANKGFALNATAKTVIKYYSSNEKVAVVSVSGRVIFKKCGKTVITVQTNDAQKEVTVIVVPNKAKAGKITSRKSGELKVSWKSQQEAAGYIVEYSTDKNFKKKVVKKTIKSNKKTSITLKKLKKGRKYYVRVMAYTKVGSEKICGKASKIQNKKVKK